MWEGKGEVKGVHGELKQKARQFVSLTMSVFVKGRRRNSDQHTIVTCDKVGRVGGSKRRGW